MDTLQLILSILPPIIAIGLLFPPCSSEFWPEH